MKALFARDSILWQILFYGGVVVQMVLAAISSNPGGYGLSPVQYNWAVLVNGIVTAVGGKFGMSPSALQRNQTK